MDLASAWPLEVKFIITLRRSTPVIEYRRFDPPTGVLRRIVIMFFAQETVVILISILGIRMPYSYKYLGDKNELFL